MDSSPPRFTHVFAMTETIVRSATASIRLEAPNDAETFLHYYEAIRGREHETGSFADPG